ncbi:hypothetical protein PHK61_26790 [Actinomycetospora lutea]|uniref:hypothetical protein n=1 Tax=Actinomycetospora lutea TaxID=663604 RepID=UPI0023664C1B|nr:hypothetical protein [Actinomycetospora lutea]MDD7942029.1 hypothetical protein [Actinomycetospora lutea]
MSSPKPVLMPTASARDRPHDAAYLQSMVVQDDLLALEVSYPGGCAQHHFDVEVRAWAPREDHVDVELGLLHDAGGDRCKALVTERLTFSLRPLLEEASEARAACGGRALLRLPPLSAMHTSAP